MIWLSWVGVLPFCFIVGFVFYIAIKERDEFVLGIITVFLVIIFAISAAYLSEYYFPKKEPQKMECNHVD